MTTKITIPEGYKQDALGRLVPIEQIKEIDLLRDELVNEKIAKVLEAQAFLAEIKKELMDDIASFVGLSAEKYGVHIGGKLGGVTLTNFDGTAQLKLQIASNLVFDERLIAAKHLVDECLKDWAKDSNKNLQTIVTDAFQVDKEGKINSKRVLSLTKLKIDDTRWNEAMEAIKDSLSVLNTTAYVRAYKRDGEGGPFKPILLDLAAV